MADLAATLETLTADQRRAVFQHLWNELTIAGRAIWSDPKLTDGEKLDGLKWLNEIQHRVSNMFTHESYAPELFVQIVGDHVKNAPHIGDTVRYAFRRALDSAAGAPGGGVVV